MKALSLLFAFGLFGIGSQKVASVKAKDGGPCVRQCIVKLSKKAEVNKVTSVAVTMKDNSILSVPFSVGSDDALFLLDATAAPYASAKVVVVALPVTPAKVTK